MIDHSKYKDFTDEELMQLYQNENNVHAFEVIFLRYSHKIESFLTAKTKSNKLAQDLSQEVFLKLHRSRHQYNKMLPLGPWIFSITRSVLIDSVRKNQNYQKNILLTENDQLDQIADSTQNLIPASADDRSPLDLLDQLSPEQKQVIQMRTVDEATFEEIATRLATSPQNARQIFSRGVRKLKELLK